MEDNTSTTTTTTTTPTEVGPLTRIACAIALGEVSDPSAVAMSLRGAWRGANAKGNGSETYRRVMSPGSGWRFLGGRLPAGCYLARDRKAVTRGNVYIGDLIVDYTRGLRGGRSTGDAVCDGKIGLVIGLVDGEIEIDWMDIVTQRDGVRIILATGSHLTVPSPAWR